MVNFSSLTFLAEKGHFTSHFRRPLYYGYAYSLIPNTVHRLFTGEDLETLPVEAVGGRWDKHPIVILFLIDGFGWHFFEKYLQRFAFLKRFEEEGTASKISAQFPSTTSAHVSTICTGLEVGQTGIYEWFQYEPLLERMIAPLKFSFAGDHEAGTLEKQHISSKQILGFPTFYQKLLAHNIHSYVIQEESIIYSPYSQAMFNGAHLLGYRALREALEKAADLCLMPHPQPTYIFFYFGDIDAAGHRHGIDSQEFSNAVAHCFHSLEEHFCKRIVGKKEKIALLVTADHGMTSVDPRTTLYLNKAFPGLQEDFQVNREGVPLVPAGSCRDFFLHIKEDRLDSVYEMLSKELRGRAEVFYVRDLIDRGFFGALPPARRFLERVGNLVILPFAKESVWWFEKHHFEQNFYGAHGGLTPQEMESIFLYTQTT